MSQTETVRLAVDIGGTFTDIALSCAAGMSTAKVLTTAPDPERGVLDGISQVLKAAGLAGDQVDVLIHGTTLATNAIIERKGAKTALLVTRGFRDAVEMAYESRFDQYDINMQKPESLVPRHLRLEVSERVSARGEVLLPLDMATVDAAIDALEREQVDSIAIGFMHCYANPDHEQQVAARVRERLPDIPMSLSSEVCAEIREYERFSTTCANAYVQPLMAGYISRLAEGLVETGIRCPLLLMTSGGGLTTAQTAMQFPIRLVESGPAGGAILACEIARSLDLDSVLSFDMGGTTAKICLIDDAKPQSSRTFEVDRAHRFTRGSGLPLRIPVIEMVEIGAGGGSIASIDGLGRIQIGPESAGSQPGPACYDQHGQHATVTDADLVLGRIGAEDFAAGSMQLNTAAAQQALVRDVGQGMGLEMHLAALAVSEVVDENMTNAARVHAIERGKDVASRTLVAFGGAAPLHAARLAEKLGIARVVIPKNAGVGSALGFLAAPVSYEVVRSRYQRLSAFDADDLNQMLDEMHAEALAVVRLGSDDPNLTERRVAYMRYVGQGHEVEVPLPNRPATKGEAQNLRQAFDTIYTRHYGRTIPGMDIEALTFALSLSAPVIAFPHSDEEPESATPIPDNAELVQRDLFNVRLADYQQVPVLSREAMRLNQVVQGPVLIVEAQTTTVVSESFSVSLNSGGALILERKP
jgi:N-methylhydantoinase A